MAITEKLGAIADAIRGKTGKAEKMTLDQMPGEIEGIQAGGGDIVGDNSVPNSVAGMLYAITSGTAKRGSFTLVSPLPKAEHLVFATELERINGFFIFADKYFEATTGPTDSFTGFALWFADKNVTDDGEVQGSNLSETTNWSVLGNVMFLSVPHFSYATARIERGNLYIEPTYGGNSAYTPFGAGLTYYWFAW